MRQVYAREDEEFAAVPIMRDIFHGDRNYSTPAW
jgi:hypothetical protein